MRSLLALALLAAVLPCFAADEYRLYFTRRVTTGSSESLTIKQPTSGAREIVFEGLLITAPSACTLAIELNGTAATTTAATPLALNTKADAAHALGFVASNAGSGTVVHTYQIPSSQTYPILKGGLALAPVAGQQWTFRTTCASSTEITLLHSEK